MSTTFQPSAIDLFDLDASWDGEEVEARELRDLRVCRSMNCDDLAHRGDEFCPRCRDEIDALRAMPPRKRRMGWAAGRG